MKIEISEYADGTAVKASVAAKLPNDITKNAVVAFINSLITNDKDAKVSVHVTYDDVDLMPNDGLNTSFRLVVILRRIETPPAPVKRVPTEAELIGVPDPA